MEKVVGVNVLETLHNLEQDAFNTGVVQALVIPRLHQLIQVALHVLHGNVQFLGERIQKDVQGRNQMLMSRQCPEEDNLSQFKAWLERVKCLLHRLDGNL